MDLDIEWEDETVKQKSPFTIVPMNIDTNSIVGRIITVQPLWISRSKDYPFFTLGRGAYLDGKTKEYLSRALRCLELQTYGNFKLFLIGDHYDNNDEFEELCKSYKNDIFYKNNFSSFF